jgi:outer membrane protein assembly factor BamB
MVTLHPMQRTPFTTQFGLALAFSIFALHVGAADWPHWRGPSYNGISAETVSCPTNGPKQLWKASIGTGFSSIAISHGRAYTMGNVTNVDTVFCFDANSGKELWKHSYACPIDPKLFEGGPTATPTVDGNSVFTLSRKGHLFCLAADTGKINWSKNLSDELGLVPPGWGFSGSGYVDGNMVIFNAGSTGIAFDKTSGKVIWSSGTNAPGYSTPVPCFFDGKKAISFFTAESIVAVEPETGKELWRQPWKTKYAINAADPIIIGDKVFASSGYEFGAGLILIKEGKPEIVWQNKSMRSHINSCVYLDGYIYGFDGTAGPDAKLKCIDLQTSTNKWTEEGLGSGSLIMANKTLIILGATGELVIAPATPEAFKPLARSQILTGKCWTAPALGQGLLF